MWLRYNPNPQGLATNDCTVRSICAVTGLPWHAVHRALCELSGDMADMPSTNRVWWTLLRGIGFRQMHLLDRCPDCYTVKDFAEANPQGIYVLGPHEHAVAVIDGDWWDSWDSGSTVPTYYFTKEGTNNAVQSVLPRDVSTVSSADTPDAAADDDSSDDPGGDRAGG